MGGGVGGGGETAIKRIPPLVDWLGVVKSGWAVIDVAAERGCSPPDDLAAGVAVCPRVKLGVLLRLEGTGTKLSGRYHLLSKKLEILLLSYREC